MDHGHLLALDTPEALMRSLPGKTTLEITSRLDGVAPGEVTDDLVRLAGVERVERVQAAGPAGPPGVLAPLDGGGELRLRLYVSGDAPQLVAPVAGALAARGLPLTDVKLGTPSLEDVFIELTGRTLR
jgi:ABC-2 type transport system ATP-binding protein